jgi:Glucodextranase, domain B/FecR protein
MVAPAPPRPTPPRRAWAFYALVAAILLALPAGYFLFLSRSDPLPAPPPEQAPAKAPEPEKKMDVRIASLEGNVEVRHLDGTWAPAQVGDELVGTNAVRTLDGAEAVLAGGEAWQVRMEAGTEVSVDELTESISRILLANGMATATVRGGAKHAFEVRAAGSDAVAKTSAGTFAISNNGEGTVAVGTRDGEVELSGNGQVVIVRSGQQSIVHPGKAPTEPTAVPSSLLLKVKWPEKSLLTRRKLVVTGQTQPGAHVQVAGHVVRASRDGRFSQRIQLSEGHNQIGVRAVTVGGAQAESDAELQVDTRDPTIGIDRDLWK